jgi:hypothetical protein
MWRASIFDQSKKSYIANVALLNVDPFQECVYGTLRGLKQILRKVHVSTLYEKETWLLIQKLSLADYKYITLVGHFVQRSRIKGSFIFHAINK